MIIETMYFPPLSVIQMVKQRSSLTIERKEHYRKNSFRNVCFIATANGIQRLTVPLMKGKNSQQPITDVRISYDMNWPKQHLAAIQTAYGKSPWLAHYVDSIADILHRQHRFLWELNSDVLDFLLRVFHIDTPVEYTDDYLLEYPEAVDWRDKIRPGTFHQYQTDYYPQLFEDRLGYVANLSSLDYLMCMGRQLPL